MEHQEFDYTGVAPEIVLLHKMVTSLQADSDATFTMLKEQMALSSALSLTTSALLASNQALAANVRALVRNLPETPNNAAFMSDLRTAFQQHLQLQL